MLSGNRIKMPQQKTLLSFFNKLTNSANSRGNDGRKPKVQQSKSDKESGNKCATRGRPKSETACSAGQAKAFGKDSGKISLRVVD